MLGDTAVAVHPDDPRYRHLIGKKVRLPLTTREIPIVGDSILVDREFGTGAVKITPAHDFNDYEAGERHELPRIADSSIISVARSCRSARRQRRSRTSSPTVARLPVPKARPKIEQALNDRGLLVKTEDHKMAIGKCYRCKTSRRALPLASMVRQISSRWRSRRSKPWRMAGSNHSRRLDQQLSWLDAGHQRLVHLTADLVGPSNSRLVLRTLQRTVHSSADDHECVGHRHYPHDSAPRREAGRRPNSADRLPDQCGGSAVAPRPGRAGYLVLLRSLALLHVGVAGAHAGT